MSYFNACILNRLLGTQRAVQQRSTALVGRSCGVGGAIATDRGLFYTTAAAVLICLMAVSCAPEKLHPRLPERGAVETVVAPAAVETASPPARREETPRCVPAAAPLPLAGVVYAPQGSLLWPACLHVPRPLLVVTHGAGGSPDWHCEFWKQRVRESAHLLCVRGKLINSRQGAAGGYYYPEHSTLARWLDANIDAALEMLGERALSHQIGFVGYSQGASMGALALGKTRHHFRLAVWLEGGFDHWSLRRAKTLQKRGLTFVALACGTSRCAERGRHLQKLLRQAGVWTKLGGAPHAGHRPDAEVGRAAADALAVAWPVVFRSELGPD